MKRATQVKAQSRKPFLTLFGRNKLDRWKLRNPSLILKNKVGALLEHLSLRDTSSVTNNDQARVDMSCEGPTF